jgi:hypothetical protein
MEVAMRKSFAFSFLFIVVTIRLSAQDGVSFRNGERWVDYVFVSFDQEVISSRDPKSASLNNIKARFSNLKNYLESLGDLLMEKQIEGSFWGDTIRTNDLGQRIGNAVPPSRHC